MLESFDISEAINEDENSKKKNNNLIIETKETLMEKQGRRDLVKLQVRQLLRIQKHSSATILDDVHILQLYNDFCADRDFNCKLFNSRNVDKRL
jgi:hypothetical protein